MQQSGTKEKTSLAPIRLLYIIAGVLCLGLGAVGLILPLVPTTPLVLLAAFCFGKSSQKLHKWFISTRLYTNSIEGFVKNKTMSKKAKFKLLAIITAVMGSSLFLMCATNAPIIPRVVLGVVWGLHVLYFGIKVKTKA